MRNIQVKWYNGIIKERENLTNYDTETQKP